MPPQPRALRPKDDNNNPSDNTDGSSEVKSGKRRAVSSACIPCRKRKSKVCAWCPGVIGLLTMSSVTAVCQLAQLALLSIEQNALMT